MLSPFLKKLLFARQFFMKDGKISVLGTEQVMLPADVVLALQSIDDSKAYTLVKDLMKKHMKSYAHKVGSGEEGLLNVAVDIFESFGLGSLKIVSVDMKKKTAKLVMQKSSTIAMGVLVGFFSFIFEADMEIVQKNDYYELKEV